MIQSFPFRRLLPLAALPLLGSAGQAAAPAPLPGSAMIRTMAGECDRLSLAGTSRSRCEPRLIHLVYANGAMSFVFTARDGRLLSFRTRLHRQQGMQSDLKIDQITLVSRDGRSADSLPARGRCTLVPFAVDRGRVDCSARAGRRTFAGQFRTSDQPARLMTLTSR